MQSESNERKVLSRRAALKRCAALTLGVVAVSVSRAVLADGTTNCSYYSIGGSGGYSSASCSYTSKG